MRDPVLVDTNVFGAELGRRRRSTLIVLYRPHLLGRVLVIAGQTVAEMEFGAELAGWGAARRTRPAAVIGTAEISWPDPETARCFARLKAACWRDGHPLAQAAHTADAWIAATAIRRGMALVSHDAVFQRRTEFELITELPPASA